MSRYDGLIIPRSYSEYINKTDAATLQQALQLSGVMDNVPTTGSNNPVKSGGVKTELEKYINKTDAATLQQALQQSGVMDAVPTTGSNNPVKSGGVKTELEKYIQFRTIIFSGGGGTYEIPIDPNEPSKNLIIQGWITATGQVLDIISYYDAEYASIKHITEVASLSYETTTAGMLKITNNSDSDWKGFRGNVILIF